jgi:two-component system, OmpR family, sensor histidine kinase KdpD
VTDRFRLPITTVVRLALVVAGLVVSTAVIAVLDVSLGVQTATVYLLAVVGSAVVAGTVAAVITSVAAFLLFDLLFTEPRLSLSVRDPEEWLTLLVFLFVSLVVGRLTAQLVRRADEAVARAAETQTMFRISRALSTSGQVTDAAPDLLVRLRQPAGVDRLWLGIGTTPEREQVLFDTEPDEPRTVPASFVVLRRTPDERPAEWVRIHEPRPGRGRRMEDEIALRVVVEADGKALGSLWAIRTRAGGLPHLAQTRLLAAAADQLGQSLRRDRLVAEATAAEIARESDALKSALVQSVSHDFRTPLATIRAAAGTLGPDSRLSPQERRESVEAIDREVAYLDRLVTNLLDLSRIDAGALRAEREIFELDDLVDATVERIRPRLEPRPVEVSVRPDLVDADPVLLDDAMSNVLENAVKYVPTDAPIRISSAPVPETPFVRLTIEDGGPGVPDSALPRLFERFYRAPGAPAGSRSGTGIGLAVVRGMMDATGGRATARRSPLGGLAVDLDIPRAIPLPPEPASGDR